MPKEVVGEGGATRLQIELELTTHNNHKVTDLSCTVISHLGQNILREALLGHEIEEGIRLAVNAVENRFFSSIKKATIAALEDAHLAYKRLCKEQEQ